MKIAYRHIAGSLLLVTMVGCAAGQKQETVIPPEEVSMAASDESAANSEQQEEAVLNQTRKNSSDSKTTLIFNEASCSWSYIDENGTLQSVSITGRKASYVSSGKVYDIDVMKTKLVFE